MQLKFTKMHGAGNDFVMLDAISQHLKLRPRDIRRLADRRRGIGCDQVLLVEAPGHPDADFRYRIFNADGSEAGQCGNGARCFARFVRHRKLTQKRQLVVETCSGELKLSLKDNHQVQVDMGTPRWLPSEVPIARDAQADDYQIVVNGEEITVGAVSMGNPHAVLRVDDVNKGAVERLGPAIECHEDFPDRVNAGFLQVIDRENAKLRVYERGVGETLACGSGACAAIAYGHRKGWFDNRVTVELPGGKLIIEWQGGSEPILMTGPTAISYEGTVRL